MFGELLLTASFLAGQAPPAVMPAAPGVNIPAVPAPAAPAAPPVVYAPAAEAPAAPAAEEPQPYFLEALLADTSLGKAMKERNFHIYGWTQGNYTTSNTRRSNLPYTMNDRADFWQMNQNFLHIDKSIDTSKKEFQLGGTAELILPGTDSRYTISRGLLSKQLRDGVDYPIDLFQAYAEFFLPNVGPEGTSLKVGKFATHLEYELVQGPLTPFLTRSLLFQYNPFTHTGFWATTPLNDTWTVSNGLALGNDVFWDEPNRPTYLGQIKWSPKDGNDTVLFGVSVTDPQFDASNGFAFYNVYNLQWTHKFNDSLTYQLDASYSHMYDVPGTGFADWYGMVNYLFWKHNDQFTSNFRVELFEDSEGVRTGTQGLYTGLTYGLTYSPCQAFLFRPFVHYCHNNNNPFEGKKDLFMAGIDAIVRW